MGGVVVIQRCKMSMSPLEVCLGEPRIKQGSRRSNLMGYMGYTCRLGRERLHIYDGCVNLIFRSQHRVGVVHFPLR